jgi:hypothetical protein
VEKQPIGFSDYQSVNKGESNGGKAKAPGHHAGACCVTSVEDTVRQTKFMVARFRVGVKGPFETAPDLLLEPVLRVRGFPSGAEARVVFPNRGGAESRTLSKLLQRGLSQ